MGKISPIIGILMWRSNDVTIFDIYFATSLHRYIATSSHRYTVTSLHRYITTLQKRIPAFAGMTAFVVEKGKERRGIQDPCEL